MVGGALKRPAGDGDPLHGLRERRARGVQPGHVVQAGGARREGRGRRDVGQHERGALGIGAQPRFVLLARDERKPEHAPVEVGASRQVAHIQRYGANTQIGIDRGHRLEGSVIPT